MFNIVTVSLIVYLFLLFQNPENIYLQRFDITVTLWCNFVFFMLCLGYLMCVNDEIKNKLMELNKKSSKTRKFINAILTIIMLVLLLLNGFSYCFVIYCLSYYISYLIVQRLEGENK